MGTVHFIDTSVLVELLNIPGMNERYTEAKEEFELLWENGDEFVLPVAVLVETGNHIAHISDGNRRREIAEKFVHIVMKAIEMKDRWNTMPKLSTDILKAILTQFPDSAMAGTGFGDISIVEQFNDYWQNRQPIGKMRIWSFDRHLSGYSHTGGLSRRKNR